MFDNKNNFNMMREKILQISTKWLIKKGYCGTSMSIIAKECGIHKSSLYHYFESKEALVLLIVENQIQNLKKSFGVNKNLKNKKLTDYFFEELYNYFEVNYSGHFLMVLLAVEFLDGRSEGLCGAIKRYFNGWIELIKKHLPHRGEKEISMVDKKMLALFTSHCFLKFIGMINDKLSIISAWKNVFNDTAPKENYLCNDLSLSHMKIELQASQIKPIYFNNKEKSFLKLLVAEANPEYIVKKTRLTRRSVDYILNNLIKKLVQSSV
jgi:AcrR family transcriptional regulator